MHTCEWICMQRMAEIIELKQKYANGMKQWFAMITYIATRMCNVCMSVHSMATGSA